MTYPIKADGAGRKGGQKRRERTYPSSTDKSVNQWQHPFTEIWHNNEPFMIAKLRNIPIERSLCIYCQKEFPRGPLAIVPFDIVVAHRERWMSMNRNRTSDTKPLYIPSSAKKLTTKYYYIRRNCIYNRFPYFTSQLIKIDDGVILLDSRKKIIKEQLDVSI